MVLVVAQQCEYPLKMVQMVNLCYIYFTIKNKTEKWGGGTELKLNAFCQGAYS